jgi:hypothetical protein
VDNNVEAVLAVAGIVAVVVALLAYIYIPAWLDERRMRREVEKRDCEK